MISCYGLFNSLSQTLLKIASPDIPDFYQGTETWDFSLVDPDNRRPVDYTAAMSIFSQLKQSELEKGK
jgi:(1->4)-alpha-D-glucan 1-alpha-D-glucosylmutase